MRIRCCIVVVGLVVMFPSLGYAQFGAIGGVVKDTSGAVLPGVTVEAASPALIEKVRISLTDAEGQYKVENLRPGVYAVTFTLAGFNTARREGVELSAGFTALVNAEMRVGALQETVTVVGESPIVDVQNVIQQHVVSRQTMQELPTSKRYSTLATTSPSISSTQGDVGGSGLRAGELWAHGGNSNDMTLMVNGVPQGVSHATFGNSTTTLTFNDAAMQEVVYETSAISAETASGGVKVNMILADGGNSFSGTFFGNFATKGMSRSNYSDDLKARGLAAPVGFEHLWDVSASFGGPIRRDRLWFFLAHRNLGNDFIGANSFYEGDPNDFIFDADTSRPLHAGAWNVPNQARLTAQLTQRNKVSGYFHYDNRCFCKSSGSSPAVAGESATRLTYPRVYMSTVEWQATISPRLLWDSGVSHSYQDFRWAPPIPTPQGSRVSALEATTGRRIRAAFVQVTASGPTAYTFGRGALSYVTGSHAFKFGFTLNHLTRDLTVYDFSRDSMSYNLFNGRPQSVTLTTAPYTLLDELNPELGIYAQDKWTFRRLTTTLGIRFDYVNARVLEQSAPAGKWIGPRSFPEVNNVPNWKDISPRFGVSYDLFGTGKTALKVTASRYVTSVLTTITQNINPFTTTVNSATRTWNDANGNFIPEGDPLNPLPNGEFLGTIDPNFGKTVVTTRYDPDVTEGWGKRPYDWEYSGSVQHELFPRVSIDVGYFRRQFGNFTVRDNLDVTPSDFDHFCITAPTDSRLGDVSGSSICGLYDVTPTKAGLASNQLITFAKNYSGKAGQVFNGIDFSINARGDRLSVMGGVSFGRTVTENCSEVDSPGTLRFCKVVAPFLDQSKYNVSGTYLFPWEIRVSGVFQSIPPVQSLASYAARNADAAASLGRSIATPGGVIDVALVEPFTLYNDRTNQLDMRVSKLMRVGRYRFEIMADLYNLWNVAPVQTSVNTYGPTWLRPASILQSNFLKLGGQFWF